MRDLNFRASIGRLLGDPTRLAVCLIGCAALLLEDKAVANVFSVGTDGSCTHGSLDDALVAAAQNGPSKDEIHLSNEIQYNNVAVTIAQEIEILGGYTACADTDPAAATTLHGQGFASGKPVISVIPDPTFFGAMEIGLEDLVITGGGSQFGGGLDVTGEATVTLERVSVLDNDAAFGGGIAARGNGELAVVQILDSVIAANTAVDGGGIYLDYGRVYIGTGTQVIANTANNGGGLYVAEGPASIYGAGTSIALNRAYSDGGGVYVNGGGFSLGSTFLAPSDYADWPRIEKNTAGRDGGGAFLHFGAIDVFEGTIAQNAAERSGGAVASDLWGTVELSVSDKPCDPVHGCAEVAGNSAWGAVGTSGHGGAFAWYGPGAVDLYRSVIRDNRSGTASLMSASGVRPELRMENSVVRGQVGSEYLIEGDLDLSISESTLVGDDYSKVARLDSGIAVIDSSIFLDYNGPPVLGTPTTVYLGCLGWSPGPLGPGEAQRVATVDHGDFVNPDAGNYALREESVAVDFCLDPYFGLFTMRDLQGGSRGVPFRNPGTPYDLGAFEVQWLFANGFED